MATLVDAVPVNTIERILSRRSLVRGRSRTAFLWSVAATFILLLLLLTLNLFLGILIDRGRLEVGLLPAEFQQFENLTRLKVPLDHSNIEKHDDQIRFSFDESGILPAVWQTRNVWWGQIVSALFCRVGWLQSNLLGLIWLLAVGSLLLLARNFCLRQIRVTSHRISIDGVSATRRQLHRQVLRLGPEDLDGSGHEVATRLFVHEVDEIRTNLYDLIFIRFRFPLELTGLAIVLLSINTVLALQWIFPSVLAFLWAESVLKKAIAKKALTEDRIRTEEQLLLSSFQNARLMRGLGIEQSEHVQFQTHLDRYDDKLMASCRASDVVNHPQFKIVISCIGLLAFLLFLVGENLLTSGNHSQQSGMTASQALTFFVTVTLALPGILALRTLSRVRHKLNLAAEKVLRYLDQIPSVSQAVGAKFLQPLSSTLHYENVEYQTANGRKLLNGVTFQLEADKAYALVSLDPLEARAIALMLPRFIEPQKGRVLIDGEDIVWGTLESLRAESVFVSANDPPIQGSVFENIRGRQTDVTLQHVIEAAKTTRAHNFIVKLTDGYDTILTSDGDTLDLGQRFRLNLARAIVRDPAVLIIEEPTAPMDEDTKTLLVDAYDRICRDRTVLFLPSRLSTVRRTDKIVVLHEGKVVAIGPHSKLVTQSDIYRHWEYDHFNEFRRDAEKETV